MSALAAKSEERQILRWLESLALDLPPWIVDVGGNSSAEISEPFARAGWKTVIVEPQPVCAARLRVKFADLPNVTVIEEGCSFEAGELRLYRGVDGEGSEVATFSSRNDPWMDEVRSELFDLVPVRCLSEMLEELSFPERFGILKIDTESWDHNVLLGLNFEQHRPGVVITEEYLWDVDATLAKHLLLEDSGYINVGAVRFNTLWVDRDLGARFTYTLLREWLAAIGRYPTGLMGSERLSASSYSGVAERQISMPTTLDAVHVLVEPLASAVTHETCSIRLRVANWSSVVLRGAFVGACWKVANDEPLFSLLAQVPDLEPEATLVLELKAVAPGPGRYFLEVDVHSGPSDPELPRHIASVQVIEVYN